MGEEKKASKRKDPEYFKKYYEQHEDKIRAYSREHYQRNREAKIDRALQYYYRKKEKRKQQEQRAVEV